MSEQKQIDLNELYRRFWCRFFGVDEPFCKEGEKRVTMGVEDVATRYRVVVHGKHFADIYVVRCNNFGVIISEEGDVAIVPYYKSLTATIAEALGIKKDEVMLVRG